MAIRAAITVSVTSILLGLLFTHWIADSLTLWRTPVTDVHLWVAARYYHVLTKGAPGVGYVVAAAAALGAATIFWSLRDGEAGNLMFDGGSIFLYGTAVAIYVQSVLPNIFTNFVVLPPHIPDAKFPPDLRAPTLGLASSHLICSVALTGVLALQTGRWWAERADDDASAAETLSQSGRDGHSGKKAGVKIASKSNVVVAVASS
ncbi:Shr3 amino acid permease chaperone [Multifurca ochricompacta]|uniref:Shr3 amino acid permease chaperone n=1 Tax=Multifurca ochricompacta TaxID=376703 RepID=A0AAD4MAJ2_9AGAM|nr:Shr3 amino acid permease chaperone [Multifurca ochricompacta]